MRINQKWIMAVVGIVLVTMLAYGAGYTIGKNGQQAASDALSKTTGENTELKKQLASAIKAADTARTELAVIKDKPQSISGLEPYMIESIKRAGISDPARLLEDLKKNPSVIPDEPVLGGTMGFTKVALVDDHWVYGAYEDGHIAGAAIFQWEIQDSRIIWTPILVFKE